MSHLLWTFAPRCIVTAMPECISVPTLQTVDRLAREIAFSLNHDAQWLARSDPFAGSTFRGFGRFGTRFSKIIKKIKWIYLFFTHDSDWWMGSFRWELGLVWSVLESRFIRYLQWNMVCIWVDWMAEWFRTWHRQIGTGNRRAIAVESCDGRKMAPLFQQFVPLSTAWVHPHPFMQTATTTRKQPPAKKHKYKWNHHYHYRHFHFITSSHESASSLTWCPGRMSLRVLFGPPATTITQHIKHPIPAEIHVARQQHLVGKLGVIQGDLFSISWECYSFFYFKGINQPLQI